MATGKTEQARAILAKYHGNGDTNAPLVVLEMREFEEAIQLDASDKRWYASDRPHFRRLTSCRTGGTTLNLSTPGMRAIARS